VIGFNETAVAAVVVVASVVAFAGIVGEASVDTLVARSPFEDIPSEADRTSGARLEPAGADHTSGVDKIVAGDRMVAVGIVGIAVVASGGFVAGALVVGVLVVEQQVVERPLRPVAELLDG